MPKPCADLWRIGHSLSGLYSMMGEKQVESVYCDFIKLPTDSGKSYVIDGSLKMWLKNYLRKLTNSLTNEIIQQLNFFCRFSGPDWDHRLFISTCGDIVAYFFQHSKYADSFWHEKTERCHGMEFIHFHLYRICAVSSFIRRLSWCRFVFEWQCDWMGLGTC